MAVWCTWAGLLLGLTHGTAWADDCGYWLISSRNCGHPGVECAQCRYSVHQFDGRGGETPSTLEALLGSLEPATPVCIVVHGSFVEWDNVCEDSAGTSAWLRSGCPGRPLNLIFFTWPSDQRPGFSLPRDVALLGQRAGLHGFYLAELISRIPSNHPISLVGHSHGARMTVSALHVMAGGEVDGIRFAGGPYRDHRLRVVLAAAAFDHNWLNPGERYERAVWQPEILVNLQNRRDFALGLYPLHRPLTMPAIARTGFTRHTRMQIGLLSQKLVDFDVTELVRHGHVWPHYYRQPAIAQAIAPYIYFQDQPPFVIRAQR